MNIEKVKYAEQLIASLRYITIAKRDVENFLNDSSLLSTKYFCENLLFLMKSSPAFGDRLLKFLEEETNIILSKIEKL